MINWKGASPLELGDEYWTMRDAIVQAELLITRMLKFDLSCDHPHKVIRYIYKNNNLIKLLILFFF